MIQYTKCLSHWVLYQHSTVRTLFHDTVYIKKDMCSDYTDYGYKFTPVQCCFYDFERFKLLHIVETHFLKQN